MLASQPDSVQTNQLISTGLNIRTAVDMLTRLGAIIQMDGKAKLSDIGAQIAQAQGITDSSGQLTAAGEQLLPQQQNQAAVGAGGGDMNNVPPDQLDNFDMGIGNNTMDNDQEMGNMPQESFTLMTSVLSRLM